MAQTNMRVMFQKIGNIGYANLVFKNLKISLC